MRIVRQASAGFECCRDSCFGLIGRNAYVDVGPATPRFGRVEALERHVRIASVAIDDVFVRAKASVPKGCGPKRTHVAARILCHRNAHDLDLGGVRLDPQLPSFGRYLACQLDIATAQSSVLPGGGPDSDSLRSHVHVREVAHNVRNVGDRGHKPCCFHERFDVEIGVGAREKDPPVLDADRLVECPSRRALLAHERMLRRLSVSGSDEAAARPDTGAHALCFVLASGGQVTDHTHIVVVNDNPEFLEVMADILHDHRYAATVIDGDRDNALELVEAAEPDGLIIDLRLGRDELHGWDVLQAIRRDPRLSELPTIICSADVQALDGLADTIAGMRRVATIQKPFSVDEMISLVGRVMEPQRA